jgi:alpha-D-ribose 1-methylphosphonate 5-triphosphate diphosphatase
MMDMLIHGGNVLGCGGVFEPRDLVLAGEEIATSGGDGARLDASGCLVVPGIVDIHGDAFERQVQPRPNVGFPLDMALAETDRQVVGNGITTMYHAVTWSWEPGLRSRAAAQAILDTLDSMKPRLAADTRFHLRHEVHNLDDEADIMALIASGRIGCIAYNDHVPEMLLKRDRPQTLSKNAERAGLSTEDYIRLLDRMEERNDAVPASIERLAAAAREARVPQLSHDDTSADQRRRHRDMGMSIAEFPETEDAAEEAKRGADPVVFGAPNVVRGGSHCGAVNAAPMVARGIGTILASDYYYPALLHAPFRLARDGVKPLGEAWDLISRNPAVALGLTDRGVLENGKRADVLIVDARNEMSPQVVATVCAGRLVHLADGSRLG